MHTFQPPAWGSAQEYIIVNRPSNRAEGVGVRRLLAKVEARAPRVIQQDTHGTSGAIAHEVRDALVEWVRRFLKAISIGVPEREGLIAPVKRSGLVAEAEVVFIERHRLADAERVTVETDRACILLQEISGSIANRKPESVLVKLAIRNEPDTT